MLENTLIVLIYNMCLKLSSNCQIDCQKRISFYFVVESCLIIDSKGFFTGLIVNLIRFCTGLIVNLKRFCTGLIVNSKGFCRVLINNAQKMKNHQTSKDLYV